MLPRSSLSPQVPAASGAYEADIPEIIAAFKVAFGVSNDQPLVTSRTLGYCKNVAREVVQRRFAPRKQQQQAARGRQAPPQLTDKLDNAMLQVAQYYFRFHWALQRCLCYDEWLVSGFLFFHSFVTFHSQPATCHIFSFAVAMPFSMFPKFVILLSAASVMLQLFRALVVLVVRDIACQ
jgi:hypothetical protein